MMTSRHIAALRGTVASFLRSHPGKPKLSDVVKHVNNTGWNTVDSEMFSDWLSSNFPGQVDYTKPKQEPYRGRPRTSF
jgi:hypothetical protein